MDDYAVKSAFKPKSAPKRKAVKAVPNFPPPERLKPGGHYLDLPKGLTPGGADQVLRKKLGQGYRSYKYDASTGVCFIRV